MRQGSDHQSVRVIGAERPALPAISPSPTLVVVAVVFLSAVTVLMRAASRDGGFEVSRVISPDLPPDLPTTTAGHFDDLFTPPPMATPLDSLVPGFAAGLVVAVETGEGIERWTWTPGGAGLLRRQPLRPVVSAASADATGVRIAGLHAIPSGDTALFVGASARLTHIMAFVQSFAWHGTDPLSIAWVSHPDGAVVPVVYLGRLTDTALHSRPVGELPGFDFGAHIAPRDRIVAFDDGGLVIQRWVRDRTTPAVARVGLDGTVTAEVEGTFLGVSPTGVVAVVAAHAPPIEHADLTSSGLVAVSGVTSLAWSDDGRRVAAVTTSAAEGTEIVTVGSDGLRRVVVRLQEVVVHGWSPDDRFVVASGLAEGWRMAFYDSVTGRVFTADVDGRPVSILAVST